MLLCREVLEVLKGVHHLIGKGVGPATLAHPHHISLSHQHAQGLADIWVVAKVVPVFTIPRYLDRLVMLADM